MAAKFGNKKSGFREEREKKRPRRKIIEFNK